MTHKNNKSEEMSCFVVLDVLFSGLNDGAPFMKASPIGIKN
jgi:hypothetical protein